MNLIFDGHYFFYKTLFAFGGYTESKSKKLLGTKKEQEMFVRKVATDVTHAIRNFEQPDKIVFTFDSKSWRKDIPIEEGDYKGHRTKDTAIDWDNFYKCIDEFGQVIKEKGFIISKEKGAECDDLMYLWADRFLADGEDSVIVSGDGDLKQCVKHNEKNFVILFNPNSKSRKLIVPSGFTRWISEATTHYNLFDANTFINASKDIVHNLMQKIEVEEIDTHSYIFEKIIIGDAGDAVPSVWTWEKDGRVFKITPKKAELIIKDLPSVTDFIELPTLAEQFSIAINTHLKQQTTPDVLKSRIDRNIKLVYLSRNVIPEYVQTAFDDTYNVASGQRLRISKFDLNTLLSGTKYIAEKKSFDSDFFNNFM